VLPTSARFTQLTAARLYGWWVPPFPPALPLQVVIDRSQTRPCRPGLRLIRQTDLAQPRLYDGVRLDPPAETLLACARDLSELDLVACDIVVEPQHEVYDDAGGFLARGDLWLVGTRVLHEYDGGHHLEKRTQRSDLRRARTLGNSGWSRRGYTDREVLHQPLTILRDADLSLGRPHDPTRIRAWIRLLRESLFTPSGTTRLCRRLKLPESGDLVS
jgi:hypothetical protein